jgi:hypothetical protein
LHIHINKGLYLAEKSPGFIPPVISDSCCSINVREYRKGQSKMDNPETGNIGYTIFLNIFIKSRNRYKPLFM